MSCHDFRRSAATTLATARPDLAMIIGNFLGHRGQSTSERYYNKAEMIASSRRYAELVQDLKAESRRVNDGPVEGSFCPDEQQ
jgi:integrase